MKRLVLYIIVFITLLSGSYNVSKEEKINNNNTTNNKYEEDTTLKYKDVLYNKVYELPNNIQIYYSEDKIILFRLGEKHTLLNSTQDNGYASLPMLSPDKKNIAYISPYEFELNGHVYVFNLENEAIKKVIQVDIVNDDTAKVVKWLDDERLLIIIGFGAGTVRKGGDLYLYNLTTDEFEIIKKANKMEEIVDVNISEEGLLLDVITWDEMYMEYTTKEVILNFN